MSKLIRFGVSLEEDLQVKLDRHIKQKNTPTAPKLYAK
jgi:metal-responsive CopG/Arc/MetJ family transcriptional regulator